MATVQLKDKVRDTITGYTGIAIARTEWMHGCSRITIQSQELRDGKPVDSCTFDEPQVEALESASQPTPAPRGGPTPAPQRQADPVR